MATYSKLKESHGSEWKEGDGREAMIEHAEQRQEELSKGDTPGDSSTGTAQAEPTKALGPKSTADRLNQDLDTYIRRVGLPTGLGLLARRRIGQRNQLRKLKSQDALNRGLGPQGLEALVSSKKQQGNPTQGDHPLD